ncbi:MAG: glycosyltransferase family 4 protein [Candidatus Omnitrophica bacterium]|nr:glycosyltransferase family 4 protein [Candidatus Omnitrophota bacterium]
MIPVRVLIAESGSGYGGSARYLADLVQRLDRRRFAIRVVAAGEGPFIRRIQAQGIPVTLKPQWRFVGSMEAAASLVRRSLAWWNTAIGGAAQLALLVPAIAVWLQRRRIQVVHLNNELWSHLPLLLAARWAGCRTLCHLHGWRPLTRAERWASRYVDQFIAVTHAGARFYRGQLGGREVAAIPNGLVLNGARHRDDADRARLRAALGVEEEAVLVAAIGRLIPLKGWPVFLQALAKARQRQPQLRGVVVGHDPSADRSYDRHLQRLAAELGLASHVCFLPWQDEVAPIYAASDLVVQPSVRPEAFGFVTLEAMAAGKPVVASRLGGLVDLVADQETGLLVAPGDVAELAGALGLLAGDRTLMATLGHNAQRRARDVFTMEQNVTAVTALYERLAPQDAP